MNKMFLLFGVKNHNRTMLWVSVSVMSKCTPSTGVLEISICTAAFFYSKYIKIVNPSDWLEYNLVYTSRDY